MKGSAGFNDHRGTRVCSLAGSDFSLAVQVDLLGYLPKFVRLKKEGTIMISSLPVPLHS